MIRRVALDLALFSLAVNVWARTVDACRYFSSRYGYRTHAGQPRRPPTGR